MASTEGVPTVRTVMQQGLPRWSEVSLLPFLLAGCYTYTPLQTLEPVPQARVALVLSDQGRVGAGPNIGSGVARVEGALVGLSDSDLTLRVAQVTDIRGAQSRWTGET